MTTMSTKSLKALNTVVDGQSIVKDAKPVLIGDKYTTEQVQTQIDSATKTLEDTGGDIKKYPRQAVKAFLKNDYLADVIKKQQVLAEADPKGYLKENPQNVLLGSISQAISSLVAKA